MEELSWLSRLINKLKEKSEVEQIILFGSRARGDYAKRSDVDLCIVAPKATSQQWIAIYSMVEDADTLLEIDLVRWEEASPQLKENIVREGRVIFERNQSKAESREFRESSCPSERRSNRG